MTPSLASDRRPGLPSFRWYASAPGRRSRRRAAWAGVVEALEGRVVPSTITVTNTNNDGAGSLRAAIAQADTDPSGSLIVFAPSAAGTVTLTSALPVLTAPVVLVGPGPSVLTVARSAAAGTPEFRIFTVAAGVEATLSELTIAGGQAESVPGVGERLGGGIDNAGTLTLIGSVVRDNTGDSAGLGGGIYNTGTLTVNDTTVRGNRIHGATAEGAGIANAVTGTLTVHGSTFLGNAVDGAEGFGGGIANRGVLTVTDTTFRGNTANGATGEGGGIFSTGTATVTGSTFVANRTDGAEGFGGGIFNGGAFTVTNSTLADNTVAGNGGGIGNGDGESGGILTIIASTLSGNSDGITVIGNIFQRISRVTAVSCIFANHSGGNLFVGDPVSGNTYPTGARFDSGGHNLFSDAPAVTLDPTDLISTDPLLAPLADYGGPTQTFALLPGSPAIDAGAPAAGLTTDQRGVARPQGPAPDIGAFESRGFAVTYTFGSDQSTAVLTPFPYGLSLNLSSPYGEPVAGGRVTFTAPAAGPSAIISIPSVTLEAFGPASEGFAGVNPPLANGTVGTYTVTARAAGVGGAATFTLTNLAAPVVPPVVPPVVATPPTVLGVRRTGIHRQPTRLVLTFNSALNAFGAGDVQNYRIVTVGPAGRAGAHPRPIPIDSVTYHAATHTATLTPHRPLDLHKFYNDKTPG